MANTIPQLKAESRERLGSRYAARLRNQGRIPAVIYGHKQDASHVSLDRLEVTDILHHNAHLIEVCVADGVEPCIIRDVQWDAIGSKITHIDLTRVDLTERVTVEVAIEIHGDPKALKEPGAILEHPLSEIEIECLANQIPEVIRVDVSELKVGQTITVADLKLPEGVTATQDPETIIAAIHVVEEDADAAAAPVAEPEVIGRPAKDAAPAT